MSLISFALLSQNLWASDIAILDIESAQLNTTQTIISSMIQSTLSSIPGQRVFHGEILKEYQKIYGETESCSNRICALEIGSQLQVDYVVYGNTYNDVVRLGLLRVADNEVLVEDSITIAEAKYHKLIRFSEAAKRNILSADPPVFHANRYSNNIRYDGSYNFDVVQQGVEIIVDDVLSCVAPCSIPLKKGIHQARFSKNGYKDQKWVFHTGQTFQVRLSGSETQVHLGNIPKDSIVLLNNQVVAYDEGTLPLNEGTHTITVEHQCYKTVEKEFSIKSGEQKKVQLHLYPKMKKITIPSQTQYPVQVKNTFYGYTGSPLLIPLCAEYVHYGNKTSRVSDFERKD